MNRVTEATIAEVHAAMRAGEMTSQALVERYLDRIEAYDRAGPEINSVITLNPDASDRAARLDDQFTDSGLIGPLHGIPVLVKDQLSTADVTTTYGSEAFEGYVPAEDATIVERLRNAGGIVLAKTNLPDWAAGFVGYSSVAGQTKNPYALDRDSGGSSAGTGSGVAANLGLVGIGEDTGGSIRVPASCCNLYGLRPTTGLVSRYGISPLVKRQDTAGPMARTVVDLARVFDVITGFDPADKRTGVTRLQPTDERYVAALDEDGLAGTRIGVLRERFGDYDDPRAGPVCDRIDSAMAKMRGAGADFVDPVDVPELEAQLERSSLHALQPKHDIDAFLAELEDPPVDSVAELHRTDSYHGALELFETIAQAPSDPSSESTYWQSVAAQESLREDLLNVLAAHDLDALLFPSVQVVPPKHAALRAGDVGRDEYPVNTVIASQASVPSISMPAGFTGAGLPVGVELLGQPLAERRLLAMAGAYERHTDLRQPPAAAPPLGMSGQ